MPCLPVLVAARLLTTLPVDAFYRAAAAGLAPASSATLARAAGSLRVPGLSPPQKTSGKAPFHCDCLALQQMCQHWSCLSQQVTCLGLLISLLKLPAGGCRPVLKGRAGCPKLRVILRCQKPRLRTEVSGFILQQCIVSVYCREVQCTGSMSTQKLKVH